MGWLRRSRMSGESQILNHAAIGGWTSSALDDEFNPDGYNVGLNVGEAAGQSIFHIHIHMIPRNKGDSQRPQRGVRQIIPEKARYRRVTYLVQ